MTYEAQPWAVSSEHRMNELGLVIKTCTRSFLELGFFPWNRRKTLLEKYKEYSILCKNLLWKVGEGGAIRIRGYSDQLRTFWYFLLWRSIDNFRFCSWYASTWFWLFVSKTWCHCCNCCGCSNILKKPSFQWKKETSTKTFIFHYDKNAIGSQFLSQH